MYCDICHDEVVDVQCDICGRDVCTACCQIDEDSEFIECDYCNGTIYGCS